MNILCAAFAVALRVIHMKIDRTRYGANVNSFMVWHAKGSKPQGRQHFLKSTEPLVKFLKEQQEEESDEE